MASTVLVERDASWSMTISGLDVGLMTVRHSGSHSMSTVMRPQRKRNDSRMNDRLGLAERLMERKHKTPIKSKAPVPSPNVNKLGEKVRL